MHVFARLTATAVTLAALAGTQAQAEPMIYSAHGAGYGNYGTTANYGSASNWATPITRPITSTANWLGQAISPLFGGSSSYQPVSNTTYRPVSSTAYQTICGPNGCYQPTTGYYSPTSGTPVGTCTGPYCPPAAGGYGSYGSTVPSAPGSLPGVPAGPVYSPNPTNGWPTYNQLIHYRSGAVGTTQPSLTVPVNYGSTTPAANSPFYQ